MLRNVLHMYVSDYHNWYVSIVRVGVVVFTASLKQENALQMLAPLQYVCCFMNYEEENIWVV